MKTFKLRDGSTVQFDGASASVTQDGKTTHLDGAMVQAINNAYLDADGAYSFNVN